METLEDVECSKCSLIKTLQDVNNEIESLIHQPDKSEKLACLEKFKQEIEHRLEAGKIEQEDNDKFKGLLRTSIGSKTKQSMFAKPPKALCLHFVRSIYSPTGDLTKNPCRVDFPQILDLSPYCTNGTLNTQPNSPMSTPNSSITAKYRLMSTIVHFGNHDSGHYIAYKRRVFTEQCHCERCSQEGGGAITKLKPHDSEWFRISDDSVIPCETQDALAENPFMLMYEVMDDEEDDKLPPPVIHPVINRTCLKKVQLETPSSSNLVNNQEDISPTLPATLPLSPLISPVSTPLPSSFPLLQYTNKPKRNVNNSMRRLNIRNPPPIAILSQ
jgi:ubiquitin carboxyl-terminal hydrolase 1